MYPVGTALDTFLMFSAMGLQFAQAKTHQIHLKCTPKCILPGFDDQILNVFPMYSDVGIHAEYISNVPDFCDVFDMCLKCVRSMKLGTLRSHDWAHSKCDQHFSQQQI